MAPATEQAKLWRVGDFQDLELMRATFVTRSFSPHYHEEFGIGVMEQGTLAYRTKGQNHMIPAGHLLVINPGEVHSGCAATATGWTYRIMYPNCSLVQQVMREILESETAQARMFPYFPSPTIRDPGLTQFVFRLHQNLEQTHFRLQQESYLISALTQLITRYAQRRPTLKPVGAESEAVRQVRDYLETCYTENISLDQLAQLVDLMPLRLLRVFRKEVGLPPHAYLIQVRVEQAKRLLRQGMAIAEVASETAFSDQSHLNRHFKRLTGITPGQYLRGAAHV
jgi:AraC-like DNA-binding protein